MTIKITNYQNEEIIGISLPLLVGEVIVSGDSKVSVQNSSASSDKVFWPVINGKFKALVSLQKGRNDIIIQHKSICLKLHLIYEPFACKKFVRVVYIKCIDDDGFFQAPSKESNSVSSACARVALGVQMLQTFTYDKFRDHDLQRKAFRLEEEDGKVVCHVFTSSLKLHEACDLNEDELWSHFAVELMNSSLRDGNDCKFLAFLSFTRYSNESDRLPLNHKEVLSMTKGHVALGGGGLALFGSGCLHTWPESLQEIPWRFGDKRKINKMKFMDDSANRGFHWACYATSLGATLHELGHTFNLGHTKGGIMGRGFDDIYKYFIIDMFYYDNLFQKEYNPYYFEPSIYNHVVSIKASSPSSDKPDPHQEVFTLKESSHVEEYIESECIAEDSSNPKPSRVPSPPDVYPLDLKHSFNVGGAFWNRASALLLYYHRWFNDIDCQEEKVIDLKDLKISSHYGIQIVEFRDANETLFHHLEYPEGNGSPALNLAEQDISTHIPEGSSFIYVVAEDSMGNICKSRVNASEFH